VPAGFLFGLFLPACPGQVAVPVSGKTFYFVPLVPFGGHSNCGI
jgi:hypothetical protein